MPDVRLTVGPVAHGGHCVARHDGRVVFVRHALPGETVEVRLTEAQPDAAFWRADAVTILEASPDRVAHPWPEAGPGGVGGAELGHVSLPAQREWKLAVLRDAFTRFAGQEFPGEVAEAHGDVGRAGLHYRTRVAAIADAEGRAAMRLFRSHESRALTAMPLATSAAEAALLGQRFPAGGRVHVVDPSESEVFVAVDGARWHNGRRDTRHNAPRRVKEVVRVGKAEHHLVVDATGFWQVHVEAPSLLARRVSELAGTGAVALELYSGAGLLTTALADSFERVVSVESDADAVRAARRNVSATDHVSVLHGDVRKSLRQGLGDHAVGQAVVVLDPPRSGAGRETLAALAALVPSRVVYVACDPVALARDTKLLAELGYRLTSAEAWDLFPMTHHVETLAVFER
ncbi:class I SAM-dependent RNA methyltransferase [Demequina sp.]|uniref:class I SAM-dependent RNA methyltransferase n=1 Tax=Demequina sp. TaxID=2050685 RepID=UPI003D09D1FF